MQLILLRRVHLNELFALLRRQVYTHQSHHNPQVLVVDIPLRLPISSIEDTEHFLSVSVFSLQQCLDVLQFLVFRLAVIKMHWLYLVDIIFVTLVAIIER